MAEEHTSYLYQAMYGQPTKPAYADVPGGGERGGAPTTGPLPQTNIQDGNTAVNERASFYQQVAQNQYPNDPVQQKKYLEYLISVQLPVDIRRMGLNPRDYQYELAEPITRAERLSQLPEGGLRSLAKQGDKEAQAELQRRGPKIVTSQSGQANQSDVTAGVGQVVGVGSVRPPPVSSGQQTMNVGAKSFGEQTRTVNIVDERGKTVDVYRETYYGFSDPFEEVKAKKQVPVDIANMVTGASLLQEVYGKKAGAVRKQIKAGADPFSSVGAGMVDIVKTDVPVLSPVYQLSKAASKGDVRSFGPAAIEAGAGMLLLGAPSLKLKPKVSTVGTGVYEELAGGAKVTGRLVTRVKPAMGTTKTYVSDFVSGFEAAQAGKTSRGMSLVQTGEAGAPRSVLSFQRNAAAQVSDDSYLVLGTSRNYKPAGTKLSLESQNAFLGGVRSMELPGERVVAVGEFASSKSKGIERSMSMLALKKKPKVDYGDLTGGGYKVLSGGTEKIPGSPAPKTATAHTGGIVGNLEKQFTQKYTKRPPSFIAGGSIAASSPKLVMGTEKLARQQSVIRQQRSQGAASIVESRMLSFSGERGQSRSKNNLSLRSAKSRSTSSSLEITPVTGTTSRVSYESMLRLGSRTITRASSPSPSPITNIRTNRNFRGGLGLPNLNMSMGSRRGLGIYNTRLISNPIGANPLSLKGKKRGKNWWEL